MYVISIFIIFGVVLASEEITRILNELKQIDQKIEELETRMGISQDYEQESANINDEIEQSEKSQYLQGILQKFVQQYNDTQLSNSEILHFRQYQYPQTFLLQLDILQNRVCVENKMNVVVINMLGVIVARWVGSTNILLININQFSEEVAIGLYDEFQNLIVVNFQKELKGRNFQPGLETIVVKEENNQAIPDVFEFQQLSIIKVNEQLSDGAKINALIINQARSSKLVILGDSKGQIMSFWINGTFRGKTVVSKEPVIAFLRRSPQLMYSTTKQFGFFNGITLQVSFPLCEKPAEPILQLYQESIYAQNIYVLLKIKQGKQSDCSINYKIQSTNTIVYQEDLKYNMALMNNYLCLYSPDQHHLNIFNTTNYKQRSFSDEALLLYGVQDDLIHSNNITQFEMRSVKKTSSVSFTYQITSSQSGTELKLFEITHIPVYQSAFSFSFFDSFRFPMILVAIFIVFIFQYWQRKKSDPNQDDDQISSMAKQKIDSMIEEYQSSRSSTRTNDQETINQRFNKSGSRQKNTEEEEIPFDKFK